MAENKPAAVRTRAAGSRRRTAQEPAGASSQEFHASFGEELARVLNLDSWDAGLNLDEAYRRIAAEVEAAVEHETRLQRRVRDEVFPQLDKGPQAPPGAGYYRADVAEIAEIHRRLLFAGGVEAVDGTSHVHDSLPLTVYQLGAALVSYHGSERAWSQRLFRRDLRQAHEDPVADALAQLERRGQRSALNHEGSRDRLSQLARRAIMSYAERAILVHRSTALWRIGHGNPAAYELLSGAGNADLMIESVRLLERLIAGHQKFVFVASEPADLVMLTIGQALRPLEYAIVGTLAEQLAEFVEELRFAGPVTVDDHWDGVRLSPEKWIRRFQDDLATNVVVGVYRATRLAPAHVFFAHADHAADAAKIALADSVLQEHRGFPLLIDLADAVCRSVYGGGSLNELAGAAYAAANVPFRYGSERMSRDR